MQRRGNCKRCAEACFWSSQESTPPTQQLGNLMPMKPLAKVLVDQEIDYSPVWSFLEDNQSHKRVILAFLDSGWAIREGFSGHMKRVLVLRFPHSIRV